MMVSVSIAPPAVDERVIWRLPRTICVDAAMVVLFLAISRGEGWASESEANVLFLRKKLFAVDVRRGHGTAVGNVARMLFSVRSLGYLVQEIGDRSREDIITKRILIRNESKSIKKYVDVSHHASPLRWWRINKGSLTNYFSLCPRFDLEDRDFLTFQEKQYSLSKFFSVTGWTSHVLDGIFPCGVIHLSDVIFTLHT